MKNVLRAFAVSLVVTGAFASAHLNKTAAPVLTSRVSALPVPTCPPGTPDGCNIAAGQHGK